MLITTAEQVRLLIWVGRSTGKVTMSPTRSSGSTNGISTERATQPLRPTASATIRLERTYVPFAILFQVQSWLTIIRQAVTFFETAVDLFKQLPTYDWLSDAGITPDSSKTYTLDELQSAIQSAAGVRLPCTGLDDPKY